ENVRAPVAAPIITEAPPPAPSLQGTFGVGAPCPAPDDPHSSVVCVPGGVFVFGAAETTSDAAASVPERVAVIPTFWIDRNEVTVARWRQALARGFAPPTG